jgi:hypothetical protein
MATERVIYMTFIPLVGAPKKYALRVPKRSKIGLLKQAFAAVCGIRDESLVLAEMFKNRAELLDVNKNLSTLSSASILLGCVMIIHNV